MCGRFTLKAAPEALFQLFHVGERPNLRPRYSVAPTQTIPIVRRRRKGVGREFAMVRWGLIPSWAQDEKIGYKLINARAETVATMSSYRSGFKGRRCLIPAHGFYEWQKVDGGKQPMLIQLKDGGLFAFAGLWEWWKAGQDGPIESCTIITTTANAVAVPIHNRMPVILDARPDYGRWLDVERPDAQALLGPCPDLWLEAVPVSTRINNVRNDDPSLIEAA